MSSIGPLNTQPWLSIIIPIYNAEKYIEKCINSILAQTYSCFELLLIDDGSTDSSGKICKNYSNADNRIKYFRKSNSGSFDTRIYGATKAQGKYVIYCDADDYYANKHVFQTLYNYSQQYSCDVIQFGFIKKYNHLSQKEKIVSKVEFLDKDLFLTNEYPKLMCNVWQSSRLTGYLCNKLYRKELLDNLPYNKCSNRIFFGDDTIANLHILLNCSSILYVPDTLYVYRQLTGGTKKISMNHMKDLDIVKKYQLEFLERYPKNNKEKIKNVLFAEVAMWFLIHVRQSINIIEEDELVKFINDTLKLPSFKAARQYYIERPNEKREPVDLLRSADPTEYIKSAKNTHSKIPLKTKMRKLLVTIHHKI